MTANTAHTASRQTYGTRRLLAELRAQGFDTGRDRIERLRRQMGLRCRQKRRFRATTDSDHALPVAENLLNQQFTARAPNQVWLLIRHQSNGLKRHSGRGHAGSSV